MKELYLIRGLPGSGKSTFAKTLATSLNCLHVEADMYHINRDGVYNWKPEKVPHAHSWCQAMAKLHMEGAAPAVVVSNTFTTDKELKPYLEMAKTYGYRVTCLIVENRHGGTNVHDVPQTTINKMSARFSVVLDNDRNTVKL